MKNQYLKPKYLKCILSLLIPVISLTTHAQVTIAPAKENFTHFSSPKSYADLGKLKAITPASFQGNPDFGKCFTAHTNWYEQIENRTPRSRSYINDSEQVITEYGYDDINYTDAQGWVRAVDTKLKPAGNGWAATQQENPTYLYKDASTALSVGNDQLITFNKNVQFNSTPINAVTFTVGDNGMMIKNVVPNTDKIIHFKRNMVETDYLINKPLNLSGDLIISEDIILPAGYSISQESVSGDEDEAGSLAVIGPDNKEKAVLKVPACYDNAKNEILGSYHIIKQNGGYRLEIIVPYSWINSSSRSYPVTIDPVVTGTTAKWAGGKIASCIYPGFGSGSMNVTIPAGITITGFYIQASYYANPLKGEKLDDGLVYFGTKCGTTGYSSISGLKGDSSGIGTFSLTDFHSSLACCMHPSCSSQTIDLTMYLSRTAGGASCDSQYIYYDPANTGGYNFEAYIVGNTVELNNSTWAVSPTLTCGNDCSLTLTATIDYGVPPYTISHPWAGSSITVGKYDTAICGSTGSATITLTIPNCPLTSCTSTLLSVPPPTIIDACGTSVQGLTNQFITVKPVPTVVATPDSVETCSGSPFTISLTSCVSGTTYSWSGSDGSSGTGTTILDSSINLTGSAKIVDFTITPSAGGCTGNPVVIKATIEPIPTSPFTVDPSSVCVNGKITVTYKGARINGAIYNWNFGGGTLVSGSATGPGPDSISFATAGTHTISLSVTANGCTSTITSNIVTINPGPVITVTPSPANICLGSSTMLSASGGISYTWSPSTSLSSTLGSSVTASPVSTTTYSVSGTNSNGCVTTIKDTVNVSAKPVITATPNPASYCPGGSSTLTASGGKTYTWSPSTGLSATTGGTVTASPTVTTKYVVTGTNAGGCSSTDTITVTVNSKPIINVSPSSSSYCPGGSSTLTASGGTTYTWSPSTNLSATTGNTVTANPTITTTYIITGTNSSGCSAIDSAIVIVKSKPVIIVDPSPATVCSGTPALLSASGASTYTWSPSTSLSSTMGSSVSASPVSTTVYTVTGTGANGCVATVTDTVNVNAKPSVIANALKASICDDSSTTLTASGAKNYTWSPSTGLSATTGSSVVATPTITTIYTVIGSNASGCEDTATVTITVVKPILIVTPKNPAYCIGGNTTLTASGLNTYTWTPSAGLNSSTGSSVIADPTVTSTYIVSGATSGGCPATATFTLTVNKDPKSSVTPSSASICDGSSTTLIASGAGYYFWSPATGLSSSTGDTVKASPVIPVTYTVIGVDSNGCKDTMTVPISIKALPVITATPATITTCYGDSVTLHTKGGNNYAWSPASGLSGTNDSTTKASPLSTTKYIVTGTDTSSKCSDTASVLVQITPGPIVTVTPSKPELCLGDTLNLLASGALTYIWSPSPGLSCTTCSNPIDSSTTTSTYIVQGTAANGCKSFDTIIVKVDSMPKISVSKDTFVCQGQSVQLSASTNRGSISWSPSSGLSCSTCDNTIASPADNTTYFVSATNGACSVSDSVTVSVGIVSLTVGGNQHISYTQSAQLAATGTEHYLWTPGSTLNNDTSSIPVATPAVTTTYYVTGNNGQGCSVTDSVVVFVSGTCESIKVPSAFVPDGGEPNNYLHILGFNGVELNTFQVFNRWGQMVYQTADINDKGWDGTYNGKPQPIGTYVYYAELLCEGRTVHMRGSVTLIR